jgi:predicted DNA-binding transcriptional regulator AlpA
MERIPDEYKVLGIQELADELGYKRTTVYAHLTRELWHKIPQPSLRISCGPVWYQGDVDEWRDIRRNLTPTDPNAGSDQR